MDRRPWFLRVLAVLALSSLLLAACGDDDDDSGGGGGGESAEAPGPGEVHLQDVAFDPEEITVAAGDEVTWENLDGTDHTVTAGTPDAPEEAAFDEDLAGGDSVSSPFPDAGEFPYFCEIHPDQMQGTVIVE